MSNLVSYGSFSVEAAEQQAAAVDVLSGRMYFKPADGDNVLRFLPPMAGKNNPFCHSMVHYVKVGVGADEKTISFACPRFVLKAPCACCAKAEQLSRSLDKRDQKAAEEFKPRLSITANVVNRQLSEPVVQVYQFGKMVFDFLIGIRKNIRSGGDFTNPTATGFDIIINKTGSKMTTRYAVSADRQCSPLAATDAEIQAILATMHDLDSLVDPVIPDEIAEMFGVLSPTHRDPNYEPRPVGPYRSGGFSAQPAPATSAISRVGGDLFSGRRSAVSDGVVPATGSEVDDLLD